MLRVQLVRVHEIEAFAGEMIRTQPLDGTVPISRSRARAWAHNPRARPEDPAMLAAFNGNRCIGHLGMFPDCLNINGRKERLFWLSIYYVQPDFRNSGAGAVLLLRALALNQHLGVARPSSEAAKVYRALRFSESPVHYWKLNISRLDRLGRLLQLLRICLRKCGHDVVSLNAGVTFTRAMTKRCAYQWLRSAGRRISSHIELTRLSSLTDDLLASPNEDHPMPCFARDATMFNWMLEYPWVSTNPCDLVKNNYFPDCETQFTTEVIRLGKRTDASPVGLLITRFALGPLGSNLKVLGFNTNEPEGALAVIASVLTLAGKYAPDTVELPETLGCDMSRLFGVRHLFRLQEDSYFFFPRHGDKEMVAGLQRARLQYWDGECAFA